LPSSRDNSGGQKESRCASYFFLPGSCNYSAIEGERCCASYFFLPAGDEDGGGQS